MIFSQMIYFFWIFCVKQMFQLELYNEIKIHASQTR